MAELLRVESLRAGYGSAVVVQDVELRLAAGESLALLGRNGTGKTTLLATLVGLTRRFAGRIVLDGRDLSGLPPHRRVAAGIGWVPQERNIFRSLTTHENLTAVARPGPWTAERVYAMFPRLAERRRNLGNQLSGGEQQMLAIGRALMSNPRLLLLDEPFLGLAPMVVVQIRDALEKLRASGLTMLIVEQKLDIALDFAQRAYVLIKGRVALEESTANLARRTDLPDLYFSLATSSSARSRA